MKVTKGGTRSSDYNSYDNWVVAGVSRVIDPTSSLGLRGQGVHFMVLASMVLQRVGSTL